ncbi:2759_t:CDS:2, partial [Cetraspora pellucida]
SIRAGKTKLLNFLAKYLQNNGKKVLISEEMSLILEKELSIYYKVLDVDPNDQSIVFWFQDLLIDGYKEYYEKYISLKRIFEHDHKLRDDEEYEFSKKDVNKKYYESMYNSYKTHMDKVYPSCFLFDNNEDLSDD